jgi:superfamily I DNA and/or RNA helicase
VTYRHQIALIRREIARLGLSQLEDISIDTVERYQGSQRDVIIYSTGVQDLDGLEFLTSNCFEEDGHMIDRKLNVAMTRARKQLIMTGNAGLLRKNEIFSELIARYSI